MAFLARSFDSILIPVQKFLLLRRSRRTRTLATFGTPRAAEKAHQRGTITFRSSRFLVPELKDRKAPDGNQGLSANSDLPVTSTGSKGTPFMITTLRYILISFLWSQYVHFRLQCAIWAIESF